MARDLEVDLLELKRGLGSEEVEELRREAQRREFTAPCKVYSIAYWFILHP